MAAQNIFELQDPEFYLSLEDLELAAKGIVEGALQGVHRSLLSGVSVEFDSHSVFQHGDDLRHVNWKLWGRTEEFYVKRFQAETNLKLQVIIDISGSMTAKNGLASKWHYARLYAAALSHISLQSRDAAGISLINERVQVHLGARTNNIQKDEILYHLSQDIKQSKADTTSSLMDLVDQCRGKGIVVFISDLFDNEERMFKALNAYKAKGHEVIVIHLLDPQEIEIDKEGQHEFVDLETGKKLKVENAKIFNAFNQEVKSWLKQVEKNCERSEIDYFKTTTKDSLSELLINYIQKRHEILHL